MDTTDFFSSNSYVFLPTENNPRVALVVDDAKTAQNAFKLYNPFSSKAKLLKKVSEMAFSHFNTVAKKVWSVPEKEKTDFVAYLEEKLGKSLVVSLYFATINDKVVLQLQTTTAEIVGYVKYPLNEIGLIHLENEKKALEILSDKKIIAPYLLADTFEGKPFILLEALDGEVGMVERYKLDEILSKFKRDSSNTLESETLVPNRARLKPSVPCSYRRLLREHPRLVALEQSLHTADLTHYIPLLEKICKHSTQKYALVYEHGDFTPWNIVKVNDKYIPFDFEHFVEDGLEYFDLIKYYYQIGKLLENKKDVELIGYISEQVNVMEINSLLKLFLIKEIIRNKEENEPYIFEVNMLETMEKL